MQITRFKNNYPKFRFKLLTSRYFWIGFELRVFSFGLMVQI
jgi:hypothetical protein